MSPEEALGFARLGAIRSATSWIPSERALIDHAETTEVLLAKIPADQIAEWRRSASGLGKNWAFINDRDGSLLAIDETSDAAQMDPAGAVIYPEVHSRAIAWYLTHAWRLVDLLEATSRDLLQWRIPSAAVAGRAGLEAVACLMHEAGALSEAWASAKGVSSPHRFRRAEAVHRTVRPLINKFSFGTRLSIVKEPEFRATNVMTYIQKLGKALGDPKVEDWYDWLSDAAHPAVGARIALASQPVMHESRATTLRYYARYPIDVRIESEAAHGTDFTVAHTVADALVLSGQLGHVLLQHSLRLVDDMGLTTGAAALTRRSYWRGFSPAADGDACPCGRGRSSDCRHQWGAVAPILRASDIREVTGG